MQVTPAGHHHRYKPLPKGTYKRVEEVQPNGARCPVTLMDNFMHLLQLAHLIPRAIELLTVRGDMFSCDVHNAQHLQQAQKIACVRGWERDEFNSGTSANLLYCAHFCHSSTAEMLITCSKTRDSRRYGCRFVHSCTAYARSPSRTTRNIQQGHASRSVAGCRKARHQHGH